MSFDSLQIKPEIVKALKEIGIERPTKIQEKTIPLVRAGKDVIGSSKTGSGKTAAFGVPLLDMLEPGTGLHVLIMAPTRELAVQIAGELRKFGKYVHPNVVTIYGGVAIQPQIDRLRKADIVVGTPGRLLDHIQRRTMDLSHIKMFVLDEADKMVEMGFIEDISRILDHTPKSRQGLLYGATVSDEVEHLKQRYMRDPVSVKTDTQLQADYLKQYFYDCQANEKFSILVNILKTEKVERVIVFCSAISTVDIVARNLKMQGFPVESIHGKLSQNRRLAVIKGFNEGKNDMLVASPVAARGLHIDRVSHVINYDLSQDPQEYIHRVGRTARAGEQGKAITLIGPKDHETFNEILGRFPVKIIKLPKGNFPRISFNARMEGRGRPGRGPPRGGFRGSSRGGFRGPPRRDGFRGERSETGPSHRPGHPPKF